MNGGNQAATPKEPAMTKTQQIQSLRNEAGQAGDLVQVALCDLALGWSRAEMADTVRAACPPRIRRAGALRRCLAALVYDRA